LEQDRRQPPLAARRPGQPLSTTRISPHSRRSRSTAAA
jgi:hypothetical protein